MAIKNVQPFRPLAHSNVDARRRDLARAIIDGADVKMTGKALGYAAPELQQVLDHAGFAMAIRTELQRKLANVTAPQALNVLSELMVDKNVNPAVRRQAASDLLDRAGHIAPKATERDIRSETAPLSDMSTDALQTLVARLESELAARARPVSSPADVPNGPISGLKKDNAL